MKLKTKKSLLKKRALKTINKHKEDQSNNKTGLFNFLNTVKTIPNDIRLRKEGGIKKY